MSSLLHSLSLLPLWGTLPEPTEVHFFYFHRFLGLNDE